MTVEWIDAPGEWYNSFRDVYHEIGGSPDLTTESGRRVGRCAGAQTIRHFCDSPSADFVIHAHVNIGTNANSGTAQIFRALDGAAHHLDVVRNSDGKVAVTRSGTVLETTAASQLSNDTWYWLSLAGHIADAGGTWQVKVNGTTILSGTGDTRNGSTGTATKLQIGNENAGISGSWLLFRDVVMLTGTTTALAERRVAYVQPNGAGDTTQWTPSAGSNWENVDERDGAPDDNATYNSETTNGQKDLYRVQSLPSSAAAIDAVTEVCRMAHAISSHQLARRVLRTGGSEHDSGDFGLPVGYAWRVGSPRELNPTTAAAWDEAEIHRLQVGVKKAS